MGPGILRAREGTEPLSAADASWLRMEQPENPMTITALLRFDAPLDPDAVRALLETRVVEWDRFHQRVVEGRVPLARPRWAATRVDLAAHLHRAALPRPGGAAELARLVGDLMSTPLDRRRPLWQLHLVDGLVGGGGAAVVRLHHAIGDGTALVRLLLSLLDGEAPAEPPPLRPPSPHLRVPSLGRRVRQSGAAARALARLVVLHDRPTVLRGALGPRKRAAWSAPADLAPLHAAGRALHATLNDLVLTAAAGALGAYLRRRGQRVERLHAIVPVDLRVVEPTHLGNQFGLVFAPLAVSIADPLTRLSVTRRAMLALKRSPEAALVFELLGAAGRVGAGVEHRLVRYFAGKASLVFTNVRGPAEARAFAGRALRDLVIWAPQSGGVGLGLSVFSYAGRLRLGVSSDARLVPDPQTIADRFSEQLAALVHAAPAQP